MKIRDIFSKVDEANIQAKIELEYSAADAYTKSWKNATKEIAKKYLLPFPSNEDRVKVRKVLNNLTIRLATFVSDEIQVTNVPMNGVLWNETAKNCNKVFESNFTSMNIKEKYREALIDDAMQWVWVLAVDWWNNHKQEPIVSYVDSRLTFPDPKNWQWNNMRFFGTKLRKNLYELKNDPAYDQSRLVIIENSKDADQKEIDRANNHVKNFDDTWDIPWLVDIYNHLTVFQSSKDDKPCLYLTTWWADRSTLVRVIKMRGLTDAEMADPTEIDFGVKLFRAKPLKWSYAWVSLVDDIGQYQDIETLLTNLQIEQAKVAAFGGRTYIDSRLWVDTDDMTNMSAWGSVIPFSSEDINVNASNWIYQEPTQPTNPITANTIANINQLSQEATNISSIVQGQSLSGQQTKAEVQTLQQNINQILSYMASNYMDSLKSLWESIYRSYEMNMSSQRKKHIVIVDENGNTDSYWFKKREFISDWGAYVVVKSKSQEEIKNKQDFAVLLSIIGTLKQSVKPWSTQDSIIDRTLLSKSWIKGLNPLMIKPYTRDERTAYGQLELLNNNIELDEDLILPEEDHDVFINIFRTWLDTPARNKAIQARERILEIQPKQELPQELGSGWWVAQQLGASMLAGQEQQAPSIWDVAV